MLSPVDIQNKEFKRVKMGGYNTTEVNEFLEEILEDYQALTKENYEMKDKLNMLNENIQYYRTMESTIQNALVLAEKTAQDTKALAYGKADQIIDEAENKAKNIISDAKSEMYQINHAIEELRKQYLSFKVQIKQILKTQLEIVENQKVTKIGDGYVATNKVSSEIESLKAELVDDKHPEEFALVGESS